MLSSHRAYCTINKQLIADRTLNFMHTDPEFSKRPRLIQYWEILIPTLPHICSSHLLRFIGIGFLLLRIEKLL